LSFWLWAQLSQWELESSVSVMVFPAMTPFTPRIENAVMFLAELLKAAAGAVRLNRRKTLF